MAFSDNAIGFYLEIEDSTFTDTLESAEKAYGRYVKALEKWNDRAFKSASSGLSRIGEMVEALEELPTTALASMKRASATIGKAIKPFTQKVNLEFSVSSKRALSKVVSEAVASAISDVRVRLSEGRRMKKVPDIVGRFDIPHLEEGGIVKGPNKAMDSVLAMLKPGELVVPADITKGLTEVAGRLRDEKGKFVKALPIAETLADLGNLATALKQVKELARVGLAKPEDLDRYSKGVELLTDKITELDKQTTNLSYDTRVRLGPAILQVKEGLEEFRKEGQESGKVFDGLLKRILGPARFLALHKALSDISDVWGGIKEAGVGVFDKLGGETIGSAIDNLNKMNAYLGMSRDQLRDVKNAAFEAADELGAAASVDQLTASMADLAEQGVRDTKVMLDLAKTTTLAAEGMNVSAEAANKFGFEMTQSLGLSNDQLTGMFANMGKLSDVTSGFNVSAQELFTETAADVETMGAALRQMSDQDAERTVESFNRLGAVMHTQFIEGAGEIRQTLAKAFEGGPENIQSIQQAALLTGKTVDELRDSLKSGNIGGIFDSIAERVQGLSTDQLRALSEQVGISTGDLQKFGEGVGTINENLAKSDSLLVQNGDAMGVLQERATNNKTVFQQWATSVGNNVSNFELFGVKMGEVLDLTKEFNVAQLASIAYLGKVGIEAVGAGLKLVKGFGSAVGEIGGKVGGLTSVAGGAGGAGIGGMISGFFTGLATGLTTLAGGVAALGAVLLSPPGIAFTVSFIAALLAMGVALRIATPALQVFGDVAIAVIGKVAEMFGAAVPIFVKLVEVAGGVLTTAITSAVDALSLILNANPANLFLIGPGLVSVAAGVTALAASMSVLGAVSLGSSILSIFTGGASGAGGPAGFLGALIDSISNLTVNSPDRIKELTATTNALGGFVLAYARMAETIRTLPSEGFFGGLFGGADAAEKLTANVGPLAEALGQVMQRFSEITEFSQKPRFAPVAAGDIQAVVQAELERQPQDDLGAKLDMLIDLMSQLVAGQAKASDAPKPEPSTNVARGPRQGSTFARDIAGGNV